jgi:hypothetical protein
MGMFKQLKDMKGMIEDAPGMIKGAQAMGAQAQEMAAAQQAAAQAQMAQLGALPGAGSFAPDPAALTPIGGVTLEQYVEISKAIAAAGPSSAEEGLAVAASKGVSADDWKAAMDGWNQRIRTNGGVAHQFNVLFSS